MEMPQPMNAMPSTNAYPRQTVPMRRPIRRSTFDRRPELSTNTGPSADPLPRLRRLPRAEALLSMADSDCIPQTLGRLYVTKTLIPL